MGQGLQRAKAGRSSSLPRRHPAQVTSDRLLTAYERWHSRFSSGELTAIGMVRDALWRIVSEDEDDSAEADR